jgi:hypothetical protein
MALGVILAGGKEGETAISPCREPKSKQKRHATPSASFSLDPFF